MKITKRNQGKRKNSKKLLKKIKKEVKGITLIALVVTIIVLLILAGVSIATLTGENGILTRAQEAKTKTEEAEDIEKIRLAIAEAQIGESGYQELDETNFQKALDSQFGIGRTTVIDNGDATFTVALDSKKYKIDSNKEIGNIADRTGLKIGDYVDYNYFENTESYNLLSKYSGYSTNQTIPQDDLDWKILNIKSDGTVILISTTPTKTPVFFGRSSRI